MSGRVRTTDPAGTSRIRHTGTVPDELPDRLLSPDGRSGWYAFKPDGSRIDEDDEPWTPPTKGTVIRFMGDHGVDVPLWDEDGLMFGTGEELVRHLGVGSDLAAEIVAWADQWHRRAGKPEHTAAGVALAQRLQHHLADYAVVYKG